MNVKLDPNDERDLEALARVSGKERGELLRELLHEALSVRKQNGAVSDENAEASRQGKAWDALEHELDALPVTEKAKGFSRRDHDEVLYGWKK